jgi:hypothetical protein
MSTLIFAATKQPPQCVTRNRPHSAMLERVMAALFTAATLVSSAVSLGSCGSYDGTTTSEWRISTVEDRGGPSGFAIAARGSRVRIRENAVELALGNRSLQLPADIDRSPDGSIRALVKSPDGKQTTTVTFRRAAPGAATMTWTRENRSTVAQLQELEP